MRGNAKSLKRNDEESKRILIGPSMAPRFFRVGEVPSAWVFHPLPKIGSRLRAQISRHGWQADDRTQFAPDFNLHETNPELLPSVLGGHSRWP